MLTVNDMASGLVNGMKDTVQSVDKDTIDIAFDRVGDRCVGRRSIDGCKLERGGERWKWTVDLMPFSLAWAITIHKAQGMTLPSVYVDLQGSFDWSLLYVALSRCGDPEKIVVDNIHLAKTDRLKPDPIAIAFYEKDYNHMPHRPSRGPVSREIGQINKTPMVTLIRRQEERQRLQLLAAQERYMGGQSSRAETPISAGQSPVDRTSKRMRL